jgi:hypothetical protein
MAIHFSFNWGISFISDNAIHKRYWVSSNVTAVSGTWISSFITFEKLATFILKPPTSIPADKVTSLPIRLTNFSHLLPLILSTAVCKTLI